MYENINDAKPAELVRADPLEKRRPSHDAYV